MERRAVSARFPSGHDWPRALSDTNSLTVPRPSSRRVLPSEVWPAPAGRTVVLRRLRADRGRGVRHAEESACNVTVILVALAPRKCVSPPGPIPVRGKGVAPASGLRREAARPRSEPPTSGVSPVGVSESVVSRAMSRERCALTEVFRALSQAPLPAASVRRAAIYSTDRCGIEADNDAGQRHADPSRSSPYVAEEFSGRAGGLTFQPRDDALASCSE